MSDITHPTEEQIIEASKTSPEAKEALKKLYPELIKEPVRVSDEIVLHIKNNNVNKHFFEAARQLTNDDVGKDFMKVMDYSKTGGLPEDRRGFCLGYGRWEISKTPLGVNVLHPVEYKDA